MTKTFVRQLAHVCLYAHDLEETLAFYRDVLGLDIAFRFMKDGRMVGFYLDLGGATNIEVFPRPDAAFAPTNVINHLCLEVTDMDAVIDHVRALKVDILDKSMGCDDTWQSWLTDPNGVRIELFQYTPASAQFDRADRQATW